MIGRRTLLSGAAAGAGLLACPAVLRAQTPKVLKLSHQFPGGTLEQGDFRDRICRKFAALVEERTNGAIRVDVYPNSSLMKTLAQFSAVRKGALDLSLYPLAYAGGEIHEANLGLMPALVTNYDQAVKWKSAPIGEALSRVLESKGVVILSWVWQSGGIASRSQPILTPNDAKGVKLRGGSREMDAMFSAAGAQVSTMPSNEIYLGMQTGALDAAVTSSTSLISFRLDELTKNLTAGRGQSFWFMLEPILMAKSTLNALTPAQQRVVREVGAELEVDGTDGAKKDDDEAVGVYAAAGAKVHELTEEHIEQWRALARETAWKDFAARSKSADELLKLAQAVT